MGIISHSVRKIPNWNVVRWTSSQSHYTFGTYRKSGSSGAWLINFVASLDSVGLTNDWETRAKDPRKQMQQRTHRDKTNWCHLYTTLCATFVVRTFALRFWYMEMEIFSQRWDICNDYVFWLFYFGWKCRLSINFVFK